MLGGKINHLRSTSSVLRSRVLGDLHASLLRGLTSSSEQDTRMQEGKGKNEGESRNRVRLRKVSVPLLGYYSILQPRPLISTLSGD